MTLLIFVTILLIVFLTMMFMSSDKVQAKCYSKAVILTSIVLMVNGVLVWLGVPA